LANEPLAVIDQQPQIELGPVQMRDREGRKALLHATRATPSASIGSDLPR
jgi:hypothetical protein